MVVEVMRKGQVLHLFSCEREQSGQLQELLFIERSQCRRENGQLCSTPVVLNLASAQLSGDTKETVVFRGEGWAGGENLGVIIILWYVMPRFQMTRGMNAERKKRRLRINPGALQLAKSRSLGRLRRKGRKRERDKGTKGRSSVSKAAVGHTRHEA